MAKVEEELAEITCGVGAENMGRYRDLRCLGSSVLAIANQVDGGSGSMGNFFAEQDVLSRFGRSIGRSDPLSRAVLVSMVAAQKGRVLGGSRAWQLLTNWFDRSTAGFLLEAKEMLDEVKPRMSGAFTRVSETQLRDTSESLLRSPVKTELLAVLGLNGCGKSTMVGALVEFGIRLGIGVSTVKFPRDGEVGTVIKKRLSGGTSLDGAAFQMLFLADLFDYLANIDLSRPLCVADRLAMYDGQVYSPEVTRLLSLYAMEALDLPVTALVVDRHPGLCHERVLKRENKPRVFEQGVKQMALQQVEFWRLLGLPGVHLLNVDVADPSAEGQVAWAKYNVVNSAARAGVWQRALMRSGMAGNLSTADGMVFDQVHGYFMDMMFGPDGNYLYGSDAQEV